MIWMSDVVVGVGIADTEIAAVATIEMNLKICMVIQAQVL